MLWLVVSLGIVTTFLPNTVTFLSSSDKGPWKILCLRFVKYLWYLLHVRGKNTCLTLVRYFHKFPPFQFSLLFATKSCLEEKVTLSASPLNQILVFLYIKCSFHVFESLVVTNQKQICNVSVMPEQFLQQKLQRTCLKYVYVVKVSLYYICPRLAEPHGSKYITFIW